MALTSNGILYGWGWNKVYFISLVPLLLLIIYFADHLVFFFYFHTDIVHLYGYFMMQFGQVGVGDNSDHCSPVQVKFPNNQVSSL